MVSHSNKGTLHVALLVWCKPLSFSMPRTRYLAQKLWLLRIFHLSVTIRMYYVIETKQLKQTTT